MKILFLIIAFGYFSTNSFGQDALKQGPFYKNAKPWKVEKKGSDVLFFSENMKTNNGLFLKNSNQFRDKKRTRVKANLTARKDFVQGPKAKNKKHK